MGLKGTSIQRLSYAFVFFSTDDVTIPYSALVDTICVPACKGLMAWSRSTPAISKTRSQNLKASNQEKYQDPPSKCMILIFSPERVPWLLQTIYLLVSLVLKVNKVSLPLNRRHTLTFHRIITWPHVTQQNSSFFWVSHTTWPCSSKISIELLPHFFYTSAPV